MTLYITLRDDGRRLYAYEVEADTRDACIAEARRQAREETGRLRFSLVSVTEVQRA
ncbi:hypothetical protein [Candidatus Solirubrobacter pratensis]|uniref:hypothetical protein n=1 Tax=Candidatus Solirubrobacter pratensis TaxID=1298857 RepID=UPI00040A524B|nr:hypothetical protein [Candidatus Solirubrobacter pratensis]